METNYKLIEIDQNQAESNNTSKHKSKLMKTNQNQIHVSTSVKTVQNQPTSIEINQDQFKLVKIRSRTQRIRSEFRNWLEFA